MLSRISVGVAVGLATLAAAAAGQLFGGDGTGRAHGMQPIISGCLYGALGAVAALAVLRLRDVLDARTRSLTLRLASEQVASRALCVSVIESLAFALEARDPYHLGHLAQTERLAVATAEAMELERDEVDGLRVATLLHEVGRLGVPDIIIAKTGALTDLESERIRMYPVLGARILSAIPFPWPVVPIVLHHREHVDGSGYPHGLRGEEIPLGARILAVADIYSTLVNDRSYRMGHSHEEAMRLLRSMAGTKLDPTVLSAFEGVVDRVRVGQPNSSPMRQDSAPYAIARAHMEMHMLYELACEVGESIEVHPTIDRVATRIHGAVNPSSTVVFLLDEAGEYLRAAASYGVNSPHFRDSLARHGTYLTGRVASRSTPVRASYMPDDVLLTHSDDPFIPLRSALIVPLQTGSSTIGTINLYHTEPDAFTEDDVRMLTFVASLAGRALKNARRFEETVKDAYTDPVTGLANGRYLRQFMAQELNRARKNSRSLSLLGLDLDRFKQVNDTFGHAEGDNVLRDIGAVLKTHVRNYDLVSRHAGDEFTVVLPECDREQAEFVATKVRIAVDRYTEGRRAQDERFPLLGVSVGVSTFPADGDAIEPLCSTADAAMYRDKRARRRAA
ncbi:MAG TPA: HD domain-containing phosphohydrolase [Chthonomonadales bacterium]|nr:HD domain-containing phosphohydrolase [Chthonomonadales bacterium]